MNQNLKKTTINTNTLDQKLKSFAIFKLIISIIYFIPAFLFFSFGIIIIIFSLMAKIINAPVAMENMGYISFLIILPIILALVLFIITLIFTVKLFKNKYNKIMDLLTSVLFILINLFLIIFFPFPFFQILLLVSSIIFILNIIFTIKISNN